VTTDIKARLTEAADYLDHLYGGSKHVPADLMHDRDFRRGLVRPTASAEVTDVHPVAQFFWGGLPEVFLALGPAALPLLSKLLRTQAEERSGVPSQSDMAAIALADHILAQKETP